MTEPGESSQEETDNEQTSSYTKRSAKKKHYPFGTPSHVHHPFSEFAHLAVDTRRFAVDLATATDIKPEVIEEAPPKRRPRPAPTKKKVKNDDDESVHDDDSKSQQTSDLAPCTKIPCQQVVRAIADLEYKNEVEKLDLEDEYERLIGDLKVYEQDVLNSEQRLDKMTDFGNNLEIKFNQIMMKVEQLEKTKEQLLAERTEINTKLMLLELERQKANRRFDKSQKQLADARWRKKKKAQLQDVEQGLSLPPSEISENKILHVDSKTIKLQEDVYITPGNQLVSEKSVDLLEQSKPVQTIPFYLQEKFFDLSDEDENERKRRIKHSLEKSNTLDKYAKRHYEKLIQNSLESWKNTEGTTLANSVETVALLHPYDPSSQRFLRKREAELQEDSIYSSGSFTRRHHKSGSTINSPKSFNPSASLSSLGLGSSSRRSPSRERGNHQSLTNSRLPEKESWKSKSLSVLENIHSLVQHSEVKIFDDVSTKSGLTNDTFSSSRVSVTSSQQSQQHQQQKTQRKQHPVNGLATASLLSSRHQTKKYLKPLSGPYDLSQDKASLIDPEQLNTYLDTLQDDGIYLGVGGLPLTNPTYFQDKKLDKSFFREPARTSWGRKGGKLGVVRTAHGDEEFNDNDSKSTAEEGVGSVITSGTNASPAKSVTTIRSKTNGKDILDFRTIPKLAPKTLTVKHPGMKTFDGSVSLTIKTQQMNNTN